MPRAVISARSGEASLSGSDGATAGRRLANSPSSLPQPEKAALRAAWSPRQVVPSGPPTAPEKHGVACAAGLDRFRGNGIPGGVDGASPGRAGIDDELVAEGRRRSSSRTEDGLGDDLGADAVPGKKGDLSSSWPDLPSTRPARIRSAGEPRASGLDEFENEARERPGPAGRAPERVDDRPALQVDLDQVAALGDVRAASRTPGSGGRY